MIFFRLLPVILSFLLIAAHFYRADFPVITFLCLLAPGLLFYTRTWAARTLQIVLLLASLEWMRTLLQFIDIREQMGMEWTRLAIILGTVALFTLASALIFNLPSVKDRYRL